MKIATWNVNSIRQRVEAVGQWITENACDVLLLQETKCQDHQFPFSFFEDIGYNIAHFGQKTFNGVAILSKSPLEDITLGMPTFRDDVQSRYIEAFTGGMRVVSVYVPNGQEVGSEKFLYKLNFLEKLKEHFATLSSYDEQIIIGGDYNIAPRDIDVHDPKAWEGYVLCSPQERAAFQALLDEGFVDAFRTLNPEDQGFSWWDYRSGGFRKNDGLRIDHLLASRNTLPHIKVCGVDKSPRGLEKPSDHTPVWCEVS